jgi:hypothetical protein
MPLAKLSRSIVPRGTSGSRFVKVHWRNTIKLCFTWNAVQIRHASTVAFHVEPPVRGSEGPIAKHGKVCFTWNAVQKRHELTVALHVERVGRGL